MYMCMLAAGEVCTCAAYIAVCKFICMQIYNVPFDRMHAFVYVVCMGGEGLQTHVRYISVKEGYSMMKLPHSIAPVVSVNYLLLTLRLAPPSSSYSPVLARIPPSAVGSSPLKDPSREWFLRGLPCIHCAERKLRSKTTSIILQTRCLL